MIKIAPIVLLAGVLGSGLYLYKTQTNEVTPRTAEAPKPKELSPTQKIEQCIHDSIEASLTETERAGKTTEEIEYMIARRENEAHQFIPKGKGFAFGPIKSACMVKILGPGADVIPNPEREDLVE